MHRARISAHGIAACLLAGVVATSCSEPTARPHASLTVAVVSEPLPQSTASFNGAPYWGAGFSVDVLVKNQSDFAVKIGTCGGPELEHESQPDVWTLVGVPMCALAGSADIDLPPRGERQWRQTVYPPPSSEKVSPGRVRLLFNYWTVGTWGAADQVRSTPFELK